MTQQMGRWNHNIHYHRIVLDAVPTGARTALDVGTGNGLLASDLAALAGVHVTAVDHDAEVLESARADATGIGGDAISWVCDDVMTAPLPSAPFDVVASVATLHHLPDPAAALRRLADLTATGGVLALIGIARTTHPRDVGLHLVGLLQHRYLRARHGFWEHTAPMVWPPAHSYTEMRTLAESELPGVRWRQLPMWRYSLVWRKPE